MRDGFLQNGVVDMDDPLHHLLLPLFETGSSGQNKESDE
jgi:hypothetical protein